MARQAPDTHGVVVLMLEATDLVPVGETVESQTLAFASPSMR